MTLIQRQQKQLLFFQIDVVTLNTGEMSSHDFHMNALHTYWLNRIIRRLGHLFEAVHVV